MTAVTDRFAAARAVADAVLYEGYVLYPYRASARKNQLRWQFGVLVPPAVAAVDRSERSAMRTEVVVDPGPAATVSVRIRCLQVQHRSIEAATASGDGFEPVEFLDVDGVRWVDWDEAVEHEIDLPPFDVLPVAGEVRSLPFTLPPAERTELLMTPGGEVAGRAVRSSSPVDGAVRVSTAWAHGAEALVKLTVEVANVTDRWIGPADRAPGRDEVLASSLVAVHTLLAADDGTFLSVLDPPATAARPWPAAAATGPSRCSSARRGTPMSCCRPRSSSTTVRRSRRRAWVTSVTRPRSTRSLLFGCSH